MEHIGIDLGAIQSHIVIVGANGQVSRRQRVYTVRLAHWLKMRAPSRVVMEACTQSPTIARAAMDAGHATKVVPGQLVRLLGVGARGIKTDDRDAEALARASCLNPGIPSVHLRSERSCDRRSLSATRASLLKARKSLTLSIKSWLRGQLIVLKGRANHKGFADNVRAIVAGHPDGLPMGIEAMLKSFEHLSEQIEELDAEIQRIVDNDEVCQTLMQIPGVGPQVSLAFTAHVDDPERFGSSGELASYMGLVAGEDTTGGKVKRTRTIKAGPKYLKALLVQASWSMWRCRPNDPVVLWAKSVAHNRKSTIAIVALARKLATIMWSMWKHGTTYDPAKASSYRLPQATSGQKKA